MGLWKIFLHYLSSSSIILQNLSMILNFISKIWRFNFYCSGFKKKYHWILRCHPWLAITLNRISQWPCNWKKSMISKSHSIAYTDYCSEQRHKILVKQNPWQLIFHIINSQKHSFRFYDQKKNINYKPRCFWNTDVDRGKERYLQMYFSQYIPHKSWQLH